MQPSPWLDVTANLLAAVGTVGAFGVAMYLLRKEHKREERHEEEARRSRPSRSAPGSRPDRSPTAGASWPSTSTTPPTCPFTRSRCPCPSPIGNGHAHEAEFIGLVPPGQTVQRSAPKHWAASYFSPEPIEIEFLDSSGQHWTRDEQGFLTRSDNRNETPSP